MEDDLISLIIPVYNVEKYIRKCIDSVINQTYKKIEIILVDDGSTDSSKHICDEYAQKDARIKVIHKQNGGLSDARNVGIKNSNGKYITFIDSDDDIENYYIKYLHSLLLKYKTKIAIAAYTIISKNKKIDIGEHYNEKVLSTEECLDRMLCEKGFTISSCAKLYEKDLFNDIKFPKGKLNEDNGTTYKLILKCDKVSYGNKSIYNYYKRENSIMTSKFNIRKMDLLELTDMMCDEIDSKFPNLKESTDKKRLTSRFSILRQMLLNQLNNEEKEIAKQLEKYIKDRRKKILKNKKMDKRDKIAFIAILLGEKFYIFLWKIYSKMKY